MSTRPNDGDQQESGCRRSPGRRDELVRSKSDSALNTFEPPNNECRSAVGLNRSFKDISSYKFALISSYGTLHRIIYNHYFYACRSAIAYSGARGTPQSIIWSRAERRDTSTARNEQNECDSVMQHSIRSQLISQKAPALLLLLVFDPGPGSARHPARADSEASERIDRRSQRDGNEHRQ